MKRKGENSSNMLCVAEIVGAHGIKGMVKLKIFSEDPLNLMDYAPLYDSKKDKEFKFTNIASHKNTYLAWLEGCDDRNKSEDLRGTKLYITSDKLPEIVEEGTYYYKDLEGLTVKDDTGLIIGTTVKINDFGAGELLEISQYNNKGTFLLPFTDECVPTINLDKKEVTVKIPEGLI